MQSVALVEHLGDRVFGLHEPGEHRVALGDVHLVDGSKLLVVTDEHQLICVLCYHEYLELSCTSRLVDDDLLELDVTKLRIHEAMASCDDDWGFL